MLTFYLYLCTVTSLHPRLSEAQNIIVCVEEEEKSLHFSCLTMKSNQSMGEPMSFSNEPAPPSHTK